MATNRIYVHYRVFPEDDLWVGECLELAVSTSAETRETARKRIAEATQLYVETLAQEGELARVLRERGVPVAVDGAEPPDELERRAIAVPSAVA
jgi:predicted RNase H-like HicB family nuclease